MCFDHRRRGTQTSTISVRVLFYRRPCLINSRRRVVVQRTTTLALMFNKAQFGTYNRILGRTSTTDDELFKSD